MCHPLRVSFFSKARFAASVTALVLSAAFGAPAATSVARADDDLTTTIHAARDNFKPITDEQLAAAKGDVNRQVQALERFINPNSANGKQWIGYLSLDDAKAAALHRREA